MDFIDLVTNRRSIRRFQDRKVEKDKLEAVLRCAVAAPSAGNLQPYCIVVVTREDIREAIAKAALNQQFVAQAPVLLVFLQDPPRSAATYGNRGVDLYSTQDTAIACCYAQLAATSLGLGSCWVGSLQPRQVAQLVHAPTHLVPVALLALGYPDERPRATSRRPFDDVVRRESY